MATNVLAPPIAGPRSLVPDAPASADGVRPDQRASFREAGALPSDRAAPADRWLTWMAVAGVTALTALGWVLSYTALRELALSAGMAPWAATLWPLCIDLFVFVATLAAIADRRRGRSAAYAWSLAAAYSAATVAGNVIAAGPDHLDQAVHAAPAVTMVLAWHLLSGFVEGRRRTCDRSPTVVRRVAGAKSDGRGRVFPPQRRTAVGGRKRTDPQEVVRWMEELELVGRRPTGEGVAARFGVSDRTGRRLLADARNLPAAPLAGVT